MDEIERPGEFYSWMSRYHVYIEAGLIQTLYGNQSTADGGY